MTAPDGRTFTFDEWVEYLKQPGHEASDEYIGMDGKVFDIEGFRFNVHGVCRNPHRFWVGDKKAGYEVRTFRNWVSRADHRVVWWFQLFGYRGSPHGFGHLDPEGSEEDAIIKALNAAAQSLQGSIGWYEKALERERENEWDSHMGYQSELSRYKLVLSLTRQEYDKRCQLTLF